MVIVMHENSHDVDHYLSDQNVDEDEISESKAESIVSHQILNRFKAVEHLLLIDNKSTQKDDTSSK